MNGVPSSAIRRYGDELLKAVQRGLEIPSAKYPRVERNRRPKISPAAQQRLERLKALRRVTAKDLGIEIGVLCPNGTLQAIAIAAPTTTRDLRKVLDLKRWQCTAVGSAQLLQAVGDGA